MRGQHLLLLLLSAGFLLLLFGEFNPGEAG